MDDGDGVQYMVKAQRAYENKNYLKALKYFKKAAKKGFVEAYSNLASMHANGQGVSQDYFKSLGYYKKAADAGSVRAY